MRITLTLEEILDKCYDWDDFCEKKGLSVWAVNEGGGDMEMTLTEAEAREFGIIRNISEEDNYIDFFE